MVRAEVVSRKIARATGWLNDAEALLSRPREEFLANARDRDPASFYIFLAIQECIDLGAHWVADAGWPTPTDTASTFDVLADRGAIDRQLSNAAQKGPHALPSCYPAASHSLALCRHCSPHRHCRNALPPDCLGRGAEGTWVRVGGEATVGVAL